MQKIVIKPSWHFTSSSGDQVDPRLFALLRAIHDTGKLTLATQLVKLSYRHSWDLLWKWSDFFGSPLVTMSRGRGAQLSPLGEKLLWAERRSNASLFPQLENIASELNLEINKYFLPSTAVLRIHASHGYAIEKVPQLMRERGKVDVDLQYMGSVEALRSLAQGSCEVAGFHIPASDLGASLWKHYRPWIDARRLRIIRFVTRVQGLIVARDNPLRIESIADLVRPGLRFVNRQRGSGTRILLDGMLVKLGVDASAISGYAETGEFTHAAVAAFVASGMADVGLGVEPAARQFKLGFVPIESERYMFACRTEDLDAPAVAEMLEVLRGPRMREDPQGYAIDDAGKVLTVREAIPWSEG